ncbi:MAG: Holliday junction branch migration DNA helicase RuvB, partial [Actinomycetota bacterium]
MRADSELRPRKLADFVGQREVKQHLSIVLEAARQQTEAADHLL